MSEVAYCTVDELKAGMVEITSPEWGTKYDSIMETLAKHASRMIDTYTKRAPGSYLVSVDSTRIYNGTGRGWIDIDEIADVPTLLEVAETGDITQYTTWSASNWWCWPYNAPNDERPYTRIELDIMYGVYRAFPKFPRCVRVTGLFGYSQAVPYDVKQTTIIQASRWFKRGQQGWEDAGAIVNLSTLKYMQTLDPDVEEALTYFREPTI